MTYLYVHNTLYCSHTILCFVGPSAYPLLPYNNGILLNISENVRLKRRPKDNIMVNNKTSLIIMYEAKKKIAIRVFMEGYRKRCRKIVDLWVKIIIIVKVKPNENPVLLINDLINFKSAECPSTTSLPSTRTVLRRRR